MRTEMYLKSTGLYRKICNIVLSSILILLTSLVTVIFCGCTDDPLIPSKDDRNLETVIPEEIGYSSEKLEEVLKKFHDNWDQMVLALDPLSR